MGEVRHAVLVITLFAACGGTDSKDEAWAVVAPDQPAALLSGWAAAANDVWVVGARDPSSAIPAVEHYDGTTWTKLDPGVTNVDLWFVTGVPGGPVFFGGSNGTILTYQNGAFAKATTPGTHIVFGMWVASATDVWAVGGNFGAGGFAWRFDGTTWTEVADVPADISSQGTCWKVNGTNSNNVWIASTGGTMLHFTGGALEREDTGVDASLFSVAGNSKRFVAVGGGGDGVLLENSGAGWSTVLGSTDGNLLSGVAVTEDDGYAVGHYGYILRRGDTAWTPDMSPTQTNLHAAWFDPSGGVWAVGGQFDSTPTTHGVLLHKGDPLKGSFQ